MEHWPGAHAAPNQDWLADYGFLIRSDDDIEALCDAKVLARQWGVSFLAALFAAGRITPERYTAALASSLAVAMATSGVVVDRRSAPASGTQREANAPVHGSWHGRRVMLICATDVDPAAVRSRVRIAGAHRIPVVLVTTRTLDAAFERAQAPAHLKIATSRLKRRLPIFSAGRAAPQWQRAVIPIMFGIGTGGLVMHPSGTLAALIVLLMVPFVGTVLVRLIALIGLFRDVSGPDAQMRRTPDHELPVYTIMVALFDEADVLPDLIGALSRLDYPAAKLDCLFVIEDVDTVTKAAFLNLELPSYMRVVIVPEGQPQTKPRALNYALSLARGDYVVVYDAEDRPEPDQLRRALAAFAKGGARLACVQACLNVFNARQSWLTRQFTVEYSALFDSVLPALQRMGIPMPLGGTSNHFPRAVLADLHGWDPYNVTEDADLGIRIARLGLSVAVIPSTTWEEAPATFRLWRNQRTRWLKGWMQTYLVHTRQPLQMLRELGAARTLGFHVYLGGLILSALVHPVFYLAVIADVTFDVRPDGFDAALGPALWALAIGNLVAGYAASIFAGVVSVRRRGHRLTLSALLMPLYWLLISLAAYRALWQLYWDPFLWEKTPHGLAEED